jgi:hypothetical protein
MVALITQRGRNWAGFGFSIREPVREVCLNSARQPITKELQALAKSRSDFLFLPMTSVDDKSAITQTTGLLV